MIFVCAERQYLYFFASQRIPLFVYCLQYIAAVQDVPDYEISERCNFFGFSHLKIDSVKYMIYVYSCQFEYDEYTQTERSL